MAIFVFGAGATRGASFVNPTKNPCLPPLDSDFFTQLQLINSQKNKKVAEKVLEDVVELFGINFNITMEKMFTTLEHMHRMLKTTGESRDFKRDEIKTRRERLVQSIAAVFEESLTQQGRKFCECKYHNKFVANILQPGDSIINFNYDCVLDYSLKSKGDKKWNPRYGYALPIGSGNRKLPGEEHWMPNDPTKDKSNILVYKLHGSLHFWEQGKKDKAKVILKKHPYTRQRGDLRFTIIPPEWHKSYDEKTFKLLWQKAGSNLHKTKHLVLIGYSLPSTDLHSTVLFHVSIKKKGLKSLVIVNPDHEARHRIRNVIWRGINNKTKILAFNSLEEFIAVDRKLWDTDLQV